MVANKQEIAQALNASIKELRQGIDTHCGLVAALIDSGLKGRNPNPVIHKCPESGREARLKSAIKEAIDVIEQSRRAFKSKRLEALRKKLIQVLVDLNEIRQRSDT